MLTLYKKTIRRISDQGPLETSPKSGGRYISREEMESLKKVQPGDDVDRKIRAFWFPPYTGAYVEIEGNRYALVNEYILRSLVPEGTTTLHSSSSANKQKTSDV